MNRLFLLLFFVLLFGSVYAQMSDEQVVNFLQSAQSQGVSQQEMVMLLMQKGVTQEQLMRIKSNWGKNQTGESGDIANESRMRDMVGMDVRGADKVKNKDQRFLKEQPSVKNNDILLDSLGEELKINKRINQRTEEREKQVFGRDVFNNEFLTFEPNLNIATPENYILGPGDEVIIDVWGDSQKTFRQEISPDGNIMIKALGPIFLSGLRVQDASVCLKKEFARIYATINNNTTFVKLTLGTIRSIKVNVMGEVVVPGTYTLPSLATLFHALYSAGGVNDIGSLRSVKVNRAGKEIADVDIYTYLLKGKSSLDINLKDGDVIVVSPYQNLIAVTGKVKRPMVYELRDSENLADLLNFTGGFAGDAYKKAIRVIRKSGREHQIYNVNDVDFGKFVLTDGDAVSIDAVIPRFENKVEIRGAVYREGLYAVGNEVSTLKQLIEKAEGLREDAFLNRAVLYRKKSDLTLETESVNIAGIMDGSVADVDLRKNDVLYIPSIFDLKEEYMITINGAVGYPGIYKFAENMTVEDLIIQAGGLKESASVVKIDIARRIKNPRSLESGNIYAENFTVTLKGGLAVTNDGQNFVLQPFDEVYVRNSPGYQKQQNVKVSGEILFDGTYVLSKKNERLSDLVKKAGGVTSEAYVAGARLVRKKDVDERSREEAIKKLLNQGGRDSIDVKRLDMDDFYSVGIDLKKALESPESDYDVVLREGDQLHIPQYAGTVKISGAVMYPNTVVYNKKGKLKYYIEQGGGFAPRAKKHNVFVVYMNGTVAKSKMLTKVKAAPGCEIIVPLRPMRKGAGLAEIMSIASSTTSMAALVTSIINSK